MTDHAELPQALVARLELLATPSVTVMRATVYDLLAEAGVDVARLQANARERARLDLEANIGAAVARQQLIRQRIESGQLSERQSGKALEQLGQLDVRIAADRKQAQRVLRRFDARPLSAAAHSAPTPERIAHHGEAAAVSDRDEDDKALAAPRHRLVWAIDRISHLLTAGEYNAAQRLREVYWRRRAYAKVSDITGSGGKGVASSRVPVTVAMVRAGAEWAAVGRWMPLAIRGIALNFVVEEAPRGRDAPLTWVEFGRAYGGVKDDKTARGVAYGAAKTCCVLLEAAFREQDARPVAERIEAQARARRG